MKHASPWLAALSIRPASLASLALPNALRIIIVGPHPDDFDAIGVTLRFFRDRGDTLHALVCHTASGVEDSFCSPPTLVVKQALREREQRESLRFFGLPDAQVSFLDLERDPADNDQPFDNEINQARLAETILPFQPDLVFMPHGHDTNGGHRKIHALVSRILGRSEQPTAAWLIHDPKTISLRTDIYLPFDETAARWKAELLRFHRSQHQRNLNTRGHGFDERILSLNRQIARDLHLTAPYAEAYEQQLFSVPG